METFTGLEDLGSCRRWWRMAEIYLLREILRMVFRVFSEGVWNYPGVFAVCWVFPGF